VPWTTADGTASNASDYVAASGTVVFTTGGPSEYVISVNVTGDDTYEADEAFDVVIAPPAKYTNASATTAVVTILNDDDVGLGSRVWSLGCGLAVSATSLSTCGLGFCAAQLALPCGGIWAGTEPGVAAVVPPAEQ
jgi:hypothetical protein